MCAKQRLRSDCTSKSLIKRVTLYLKGNKGPKNCDCAVLSEFSLEELAIVGNVPCEKLDPLHPKVWSNASLFTVYCPPPFRRKAEGHCFWLSVVHGAWFRIFSRYLVPLTPPTVFVRSFWNFTGVLRMVWRYACVFFRILKLFFITFYTFWT